MPVAVSAKVVSRPELIEISGRSRRHEERVVFTNGCFDLLHRGHLEYLRAAGCHGDVLLVGVNSDDSVRALKGAGHPYHSEDDRVAMLSEMECVSHVCIFDEVSVEDLVAEVAPDVLVKGGDYRLEDVVGRHAVEEAGGLVLTVPLWEGVSTSDLIRRIRSGV